MPSHVFESLLPPGYREKGVSVAAVVLHEPGGPGVEEREEGETWVGYGILLALFCLLCWRAFCICRRFREDLQGRSPRRDRKPSPSRRVGGTRKRVRFHSKLEDGAQGVPKVEFLGGPKTAKGLFPISKPMRFSNIQGGQEWSQEGWALLLDRYSKSTMNVYKSQYKWWQLFCQRRGLDPVRYVTGYDRKEEDLFLEYMIHCAVNESKAPGTVKIRLAAIRSIHLSMGLPDPMAHLPRIPLAMAGIKRRWGTKVRRKPVTPEMLEWIGQHCDYGKTQEGSLMFGAVCFGYFFLLRASEYLCVGYNQPEKGLRGQDVVLKAQGQECTLETIKEADEVILTIRGSKTDIYNRGEIRNHFRAEGNVCPVRAAIAIFLNFPQRYGGGNDAFGPLFRTADDKLLPRGAVQAAIEAAAKALNMPPGDLGTHSLRFGGASAIWAALWRDGAGGPQTLSKPISGTHVKRPEISPSEWRRSILPRPRSVARFAPGLYWRGERACKGKQRFDLHHQNGGKLFMPVRAKSAPLLSCASWKLVRLRYCA